MSGDFMVSASAVATYVEPLRGAGSINMFRERACPARCGRSFRESPAMLQHLRGYHGATTWVHSGGWYFVMDRGEGEPDPDGVERFR